MTLGKKGHNDTIFSIVLNSSRDPIETISTKDGSVQFFGGSNFVLENCVNQIALDIYKYITYT